MTEIIKIERYLYQGIEFETYTGASDYVDFLKALNTLKIASFEFKKDLVWYFDNVGMDTYKDWLVNNKLVLNKTLREIMKMFNHLENSKIHLMERYEE